MAEVARELQPQLRMAVATLSLRDNQVQRLLQGMLGSITELKAYPMLELRSDAEGGGRRSSVPGFDATLRHLFPEVDAEAENAMGIAEQMLLLKRRLDQRIAEAPREPDPAPVQRKRGWWPFGR
jgi:hypothetical protein